MDKTYRGKCDICDWEGPERYAKGQALRDAAGHKEDNHNAEGQKEQARYLRKQSRG